MRSTLHLVRHGKASPSEADYDQLHERGIAQARLLGTHLAARNARFGAVYCGPLVRQRDTWRLVREAAGDVALRWPDARLLDGLREAPVETIMRECMFERMDADAVLRERIERVSAAGENRAALREAMGEVFDHMMALWRANELGKTGLESHAAFRERVLRALDTILADERGEDEIAVVTSNGVIACIVEHVEGPTVGRARPELQFANSSITSIAVGSGGLTILTRNVYEHIDDPALVTYL